MHRNSRRRELPTCIIVDPDREAVSELNCLLVTYHLAHPQGSAAAAGPAIHLLDGLPVDILFIHITQWDAWRRTAPSFDSTPTVVFLSGREDRCTRHLQHEVDFHLQPPYRRHEIAAMLWLRRQPGFEPLPLDFFFLREDRRWHAIHFRSLRSIESYNGFLQICTATGEYIVPGRLETFQNRLPVRFRRVRNGLIVAQHSGEGVEQDGGG